MGISESIMKHTIAHCENICEEVDCEIDSGCCKTHYSNASQKRNKNKNEENSDNDDSSVISEK
jgi:hypothetical protein